MAIGDDLNSEVRKILQEVWATRTGRVVPESEDLGLNNDAVKLDATVLYADLNDSTELVDSKSPEFAAEVYKCYLVCAARVIRDEQGQITAYDGDRIMAVFIGEEKNTAAARAALRINAAVHQIINPALKSQYPQSNYSVKQVVGIDTSSLFVARTGIRGSNDLVWVGRAANHAAKLSARPGKPTKVTDSVYQRINENLKYTPNGQGVWTMTTAHGIGNGIVYESDAWVDIYP